MATSAQVQQLYLTYFGRPADPEGLRFWVADTTTPLKQIADGFATTPEFKSTVVDKTFAQIVNEFYVSLFNRSAEPAGLSYWVDLLSRGITTVQQVGLDIGNAALALPTSNTDNISVTSKLTASANWTKQVSSSTAGILAYSGQPGIDAGVAFVAPVFTTATIPNEAATTAAVNNLITGNSGVGDTASLSVFQDIFTPTNSVRLTDTGALVETLPFRLSSDSQSISATIGTMKANDQLTDPSAQDSDNLNITIPPGFAGVLPQTTNIENFKFFLNGANGGLDFVFNGPSIQTGAKTVVVSGTLATGQTIPGNGFKIENFADAGASKFDASGVTTPGADGAITAIARIDNIGDATQDPSDHAVTMFGGAGNDTLIGGGAGDLIEGNNGTDNLIGFGGDDTLNGGAAADIIDGGEGADKVLGGLGADSILGGTGDDNLSGNEDNDTISGGAGLDTITGGTGADTMTGGSQSNTFVYGSLTQLVTDTGNNQATSDIITDFFDVDKLQTGLVGTTSNFFSVADVITTFANYADAQTAANKMFDGSVQYFYAQAVTGLGGVLFVDVDKNNTADASIIFSNNTLLTHDSIVA